MIVHLDKLIRHLKSQIREAEKISSQFVYLTIREAEGCLELAEAQDVIREMIQEEKTTVVRCRDCKYYPDGAGATKWVPCREVITPPGWYCADGECIEKKNCSGYPNGSQKGR